MADFDGVRQTIDASIKQNGTGAITGPVLNGVLNEMVDAADEQVSQLGQKVTDLDTEFTLDLHGEVEVTKDFQWADGYVTSPGKINSATTSKYCQPILFKAGEKLSYKTGSVYNYGVVSTEDGTPLAVGDSGFVVAVLINASAANTEYTYVFQQDTYVVITVQKASNTLSVKAFRDNSIDENIFVLKSSVKDAKALALDNLALESGTISSGTDSPNAARARSIVPTKGPIEFDIASGYELVGYFLYGKGSDGQYTYSSYVQYTASGAHVFINDSGYIRLLFKRSDGENLSQADIESVIVSSECGEKKPRLEDALAEQKNLIIPDRTNWIGGYVDNQLQVVASQGSLCSQPIRLDKGDIIYTEGRNDYRYPIVVISSGDDISVGDTLVPIFTVGKNFDVSNSKSEVYVFHAKETCYAVVSVSTFASVYIVRDKISNVANSVKNRININANDSDGFLLDYVTEQNKWSSGGVSQLFECVCGGKVHIVANAERKTIFAFLAKDFSAPVNNAVPDFVPWASGRNELQAGNEVSIDILTECYLLIFEKDSQGVVYFPERLDVFMPGDTEVSILSISDAIEYLDKGISSSNAWATQLVKVPASCVFNLKEGDIVDITAGSTNYAIVAFIHDTSGGFGDTPNFANGTNGRTTVAANGTEHFTVNEDCLLYVYIQADSGGYYNPAQIKVTRKKSETGQPTITRQATNLLEKVYRFSALDAYGKMVADYTHSATDIICINIGGKWYQKARYIHACCFYDGKYDFNATKIIFLALDGTVIATETGIDSAVEIPAGAMYAAVEFPNNSTNHFVAINNQSILKTYSEYYPADFVQNKEINYDKFQNTDGALSHMLDVALDYIPYAALGMGYGDIATAFDDDVEPVASEFSPARYEGEKVQMNCSTFAMLCLMGVFYKNSRYENPDGKNIGDGYQFDDKAEYNYFYTKAPYQYIYGADHGKMYANKLAKYAYDRGLLYLIKDDFSNVEVGDILFDGKTTDGDFFMNIGHTMVVIDTELKNDGSKMVTVFETASNTRVLTYGTELYGARFPLPARHIDFKDIVSNFAPITQEVTANADTDVTLGTFNLTENLAPKKHYTLEIVGDFPDTVNVGIKGGGKTIEIDRRNLYIRGDGRNVKHFHFKMNQSVSIGQITLYVNSSVALTAESVSVDSLRISEGYFRP